MVLAFVCAGIVSIGTAEYDRQAGEAIARHHIVRQHLGRVTGTEPDENASAQLPGLTDYVYRVTGARSTGTVYARFVPLGHNAESISYGFLDTGGKRWSLTTGQELDVTDLPSQALINHSLELAASPMREFKESPAWQNYVKARERRREVVGLLPGERETMTEEEIQKYESKQ